MRAQNQMKAQTQINVNRLTQMIHIQVISDNGDITNYVKKDNLEQAKYLLENVFNEIENKPPNMLPKIFGMPYDAHFLEIYMRSHIAKHRFLGDLAPPVCGFCGILHTGNLR